MAQDKAASEEEALIAAARRPPDPASKLAHARLRSALFEAELAPTLVGPYELRATLGEGQMGTVFEAFDTVLQRRIALKLLKARGDETNAVLLEEARALAKLAHENVVAVYDAGFHEERVYIAMELVDGVDLAVWLDARPRPWNEVVEVFAAAARGLCAAHQANLVHGDFKPSNVLVAEGRVCVADFGMAHEQSDADAGHRGGTPLYLAPERLQGGRATPQSDQFAFFVSLFEALMGRRPFEARSLPSLVQAMTKPVELGADAATLPRWLRRAVERGLAFDPARRFASMAEIAELLGRPRAAIRRRRLLGGAALVVVGGGAAWAGHALTSAGLPEVCGGAAERLATVWSDERRASLRAAFEASPLPFAGESWERAEANVDDYGRAWVAARTEACRATRVLGEQSEALMDQRIACLDRRLARLDALLAALLPGDRSAVSRAVETTARLEGLDACADADALARRTPLPPSAEARAEIEALTEELDALFAAYEAGRLDGLPTRLDALQGRVVAAGHPPVSLRYAHLDALLLGDQGQRTRALEAYEVAFREAVLDGDLHRASLVSGQLAREHRSAGDVDASQRWVDTGAAMVRGVQDGGYTRALHQRQVAALLHIGGEFAAAEALNTETIELWRRLDPSHPEHARVLSALGANLREQGRLEEAIRINEEALGLVRDVYGATHPRTARVALDLATSLVYAGAYAEALDVAEQALSVARSIWPGEAAVVPFINGRGLALTGLERRADAEAAYREALSVWSAVHGPEHFENATFLMNIAGVQTDAGHYEASIESATRAREVLEGHFEPDHPRVVRTWLQVALDRRGLDDPAGALAALEGLEHKGLLDRMSDADAATARDVLHWARTAAP